MKFTIQERILNFLLLTGQPSTAVEIHRSLDSSEQPVKLSSLSSVLKKMYDAGELDRITGFGPRGGHGYEVKQ